MFEPTAFFDEPFFNGIAASFVPRKNGAPEGPRAPPPWAYPLLTQPSRYPQSQLPSVQKPPQSHRRNKNRQTIIVVNRNQNPCLVPKPFSVLNSATSRRIANNPNSKPNNNAIPNLKPHHILLSTITKPPPDVRRKNRARKGRTRGDARFCPSPPRARRAADRRPLPLASLIRS
jgi:hypothetical protein